MRLKEALESRFRAPNAPSLRILPRRTGVGFSYSAGRKSEHFRLSYDALFIILGRWRGYIGGAHFAKQLAPPPMPASLVTFLPKQESNICPTNYNSSLCDILHRHAAGAALGDEGRTQGMDLVGGIGHGGLQGFQRLLRMVHGIGMGNVHAPAGADTGLFQSLDDVLHRMGVAPADAGDGEPGAVLGLGHHGGQVHRLAHIADQGGQPAAPAQIVEVGRHQVAPGGVHLLFHSPADLLQGLTCLGKPACQLHQIPVGAAEGAAVDDGDVLRMGAEVRGSGGTLVGTGQAGGHGNVQDLIIGELIVEGGNIAHGGLAAGGHVTLADDGDKVLGGDLVELPVGTAGDGDGQGGDMEACGLSLGGGIQRGGVRYDTDHKNFPFLRRSAVNDGSIIYL